MFINFLNRKSRTFTGEDLLDLFEKEFVDTLDVTYIKKEKSPFILLTKEDEEVYGIGMPSKYNKTWAIIIDDDKKILILNKRRILGDFNSFSNTKDTIKCADFLGEYQIIDAISVLSDIDKVRLELEEKYILDNEKKILKECEKLIDGGNYALVSAKENSIGSKYLDCFYEDINPKTPNILGEEHLKEDSFLNLDSLYKFIFDIDEFKKELLRKISKTIYRDIQKLKDIYIYIATKEMLLNKIPNENMVLIKSITAAIKNGGKTLTIITTDGSKEKVNNLFEDKRWFRTTVGYNRIGFEDIQTILFGKNVLFQR